MNDFRIITWNILEGFHKVSKSKPCDQLHKQNTREPDLIRLKAAQGLIKKFNPQVFVLNEANWGDPERDGFIDYGKIFDFPFSATDSYDNEWGNAICSNFPILSHSVIAIHNRSALIVELELRGKSLYVATYHPHPSRYPENKRDDFLSVAKSVDGAFIIAGDMNAINPNDPIDYPGLLEGFKRFSHDPEKDLARFIEGGKAIFPALMEIGFQDVFYSGDLYRGTKEYSIPTDMLCMDKSSAMRIDHILFNERLRCLNAKIIKSSDSEIASDHYPVVADLCFK